jgi:hypothetical protein
VFSIEYLKSVPAGQDGQGIVPEGEQAYLITDVTINPELVKYLPHTQLTLLVSVDNMHTYGLRVRGYTVIKFVELVSAFASKDFANGERLLDELVPLRMRRLMVI